MSAADHPMSPGGISSALVGRERELRVLRQRLSAAIAGQGGLVLIGGEAGIGKTALAETVCREANVQGALVLTGHSYDLSDTPPYGPWAELLKQYAQDKTRPPPPTAFAQHGAVGQVASQGELFEQMHAFFATLSARCPVVLLLEDLHWADPASLDLLRHLARSLASRSLLLLVTYRADELTRRHSLYSLLPLLVREANATRLDLNSLTDDALRFLVATRYRLATADEARLVAYLRQRAEGNALFTNELLRTLEEHGGLAANEEGWQLGNLAQVAVPPLLRQVIDARVLRLGEEKHRLLAMAAIIGQEVPFTVWAALVEEDEGILVEVIEQASVARVVEATADGSGFRFLHALIREALYESILPLRRRVLHRRVTDELIASPAPDPDEIAYHLRLAGDARLVQWLVQAGRRALRVFAEATAVARYEEALPLLTATDDLPMRFYVLLRLLGLYRTRRDGVVYGEEAVRVAQALGDEILEAAALLRLGYARAVSEDIPRGLAEQERAVAMLSASADVERTRFYTPQIDDRGRGTLAITLAFVGRVVEARTLAQAGNRRANGYYSLAFSEAALGHPDAARAVVRQAIEGLFPTGDYRNHGYMRNLELRWMILPYFADDAAEVCRVAEITEAAFAQVGEAINGFPPRVAWLSVLIVQGQWNEAWSLLPVVHRYIHTAMCDFFGSPLEGMLALARGETAYAKRLITETLPDGPMTEPGGIPFWRALAMQEAAALLALDDHDRETARQWIEAHDRWLAWSGAVLGQSEGQALWAEYYRAAGDAAKADEHAQRALACSTEPRQPLALLAAHRLLGELDTEARKFADAQTHLDAALALADACAAPYERALTLLAMAEWHAANGQPPEARTLLDEVRAICTTLGAKPALARADALAARLSTTSVPTYPAGLSVREVEVLALVGAGLANSEIADRLFISPRTVEQHLRSIYNKIGTSSRTAATRFAIEHHLT